MRIWVCDATSFYCLWVDHWSQRTSRKGKRGCLVIVLSCGETPESRNDLSKLPFLFFVCCLLASKANAITPKNVWGQLSYRHLDFWLSPWNRLNCQRYFLKLKPFGKLNPLWFLNLLNFFHRQRHGLPISCCVFFLVKHTACLSSVGRKKGVFILKIIGSSLVYSSCHLYGTVQAQQGFKLA